MNEEDPIALEMSRSKISSSTASIKKAANRVAKEASSKVILVLFGLSMSIRVLNVMLVLTNLGFERAQRK